ncbi:Fe-S cluster assembly sulfur transfer protein SufU [Acidiphilium acidophilum]|uniref:SUF system NifU family Fe-S cluster assembly protein n=1 Tax=Acidiphilium acidophilum TaxID=76588 RepID=A0AAW9DS02_ACIAO|nr:SUF system NifU family Fe-S cluster assembly protein [Acidiphilium acidophilum]MDX5931309.1 SUF system NifU family Fe-S cluster assembly protein [Acidiphilium acidophilum]MEE3502096.1 SUF system NifU family Fe-S cluster assembly protein [Acidiphilium acidophilum]
MTATSDDLYQDLIMDRARNPCHTGRLEPFDAEAQGDNPMCGDRVMLRLRYDGTRVGALMHETRGCAICIAAADLMADAVIDFEPAAAFDLADQFDSMILTGSAPEQSSFAKLRAFSGVHLYRSRHRCAMLPWQALRIALSQKTDLYHE